MSTTQERLRRFISENRVSVLATRSRGGAVHASVMHYSCTRDGKSLLFSTDDRSVKVENSTQSPEAAVAIGWSEETWVTVQMRGSVELVSGDAALREAKDSHYAVHPNSRRFEHDPHTVFLVFHPEWIRFSDLGAEPAIVEESTAL